MDCPICRNVNLIMADRQGIEIDYCPQCRGVWLDRGELDKIIDRSMSVAPGTRMEHTASSHPGRPEVPRGIQDPYRDGYHKKRRREGFLSDLFDFD